MPPIDSDSVATLYDLYVTADYDVPFFRDEVRWATGPVLELMAGTGRLSVPLAEAGAALTCEDRSRPMLDVPAGKLARRGLAAEVLCRDVAGLDLPARFALAVLPSQAFTELVRVEDQRAALAGVYDCLLPGGRFVCTLHNPAVRRAQVDGVRRVVGALPAGGGTLVVSGFGQGGRPVVERVQFFEMYGADGGLLRTRALPMAFAFVEWAEFEGMAAAAGFRVRGRFGSYDRGPFDPAASPVMAWVLGK